MRISCHVLNLVIFLYEVTVTSAQSSGDWTKWSDWSSCSVTCGYGIQKRRKTWISTDPQTRRDSNEDPFQFEDIIECLTNTPCPVNGGWSFWGPWSECTSMCDGGTTTRTRECTSPMPQNNGKECEGKAFARTTCNEWKCPDLPPNFDISLCNETMFMCLNRLQCIPAHDACDDKLQCHDGSDEYKCEKYWSNEAGSFSSGLFWTLVMTGISAILLL